MCDELNQPRVPKPRKSHVVFSLFQLIDATMDVIKSDLFLAPLFCIVREPKDAIYDFSDGTARLTLYYKPTKFKVPDTGMLDGYVKELKDLPVEVSEKRVGDTLLLELANVDRLGDRLTITRKVIAEVDYRTLAVTLYTQVTFAHKVA